MIKLESPPTTKPHLMADFLELCILFSQYDVLASSDVLSLLNEDETSEWMDDEENKNPNESSAEINEKALRKAKELLEHLKFRENAFGDFYPFYFENNALRIHEKLADKRYLYLFLLLCSRLRTFYEEKSRHTKFADIFEIISAKALQQMFPNAIVNNFGPNNPERKTHFGTKLKEAIKVLNKDLNERLNELGVNEISEQNTADGGLDLIVRWPWADPAMGTIAFFGQCAAIEEGWEDKKFETDNIRGYINFCHFPVRMLFIPICFRNTSGNWVKYGPTHECILFDRLRICNLLKDNASFQEIKDVFQKDLKIYSESN